MLAARESLPELEYVFVVDGTVPGTTSLDELCAAGDESFDFEAAWRAVEPDDVATLIYTSGTTGPAQGRRADPRQPRVDHAAPGSTSRGQALDGSLMSYLPMAHLADRVVAHYFSILTGGTITCVADAKAAVPAIADSNPTLWLGVPRVWEKLKGALEAKIGSPPFSDEVRPACASSSASPTAPSCSAARRRSRSTCSSSSTRSGCRSTRATG